MTHVLHIYASEEAKSIDQDMHFYALAHDAVLDLGIPYVLKIQLAHNLLLLNVAETYIRFDTSLVQVESVQLVENLSNETLIINSVIDNHNGLINFTCGTDTPFAEETKLVAEVVFVALREGSTTLYFGQNQNVQLYDCFDKEVSPEKLTKTHVLLGV